MFLYGVKNCHSCSKRTVCDVKNVPDLLDKPLKFEIENRGSMRGKRFIPSKVESYCPIFHPEGKVAEK